MSSDTGELGTGELGTDELGFDGIAFDALERTTPPAPPVSAPPPTVPQPAPPTGSAADLAAEVVGQLHAELLVAHRAALRVQTAWQDSALQALRAGGAVLPGAAPAAAAPVAGAVSGLFWSRTKAESRTQTRSSHSAAPKEMKSLLAPI